MKNSFKNTFPLDKKYRPLAGVSEKWKDFHLKTVVSPEFQKLQQGSE